ncbi:hypothetical protein K432DRAFT_83077 [Lepidopterella palustris CBS 459.81]|uniref:Uncharacterized protein n=1 Tax=Lepidopterella palustris CBS 459.81 TaxID=1314670 RepID=A0A8E2E7M1_9PEZI|nr:hypothetical protein K432DRAFT_83077 [Lepidopterella palustris CBS 459.81]
MSPPNIIKYEFCKLRISLFRVRAHNVPDPTAPHEMGNRPKPNTTASPAALHSIPNNNIRTITARMRFCDDFQP